MESYSSQCNYQPELTTKLEAVDGPFDQLTIQEIVLWKLNRYPILSSDVVTHLNELTSLSEGEHRKGQAVLESLLAKESKGVDLPMASTILRFRNPAVFQIIDRHAYRVLMTDKDRYDIYPTTSSVKKVDIYFEYLDKLLKFCRDKGITFSEADKILYELDKQVNKSIRLDGNLKSNNTSPREG